MTTALIDGDIVAFRCAASAETEEQWIALHRTDQLIQEILSAVNASHYRVFISGETNFRKEIDPEYKANRKDRIKPVHLDACREFLVAQHKAEKCDGIEADDMLGINQEGETTIICSIDKDLLQIPGRHYRFVKKEFVDVSDEDGARSFYLSSLVGDTSDNIFGVQGIGKVKGTRALADCSSAYEMYQVCKELYNDDERFHRNLSLLWILRQHLPDGAYKPPVQVQGCGEDVGQVEEGIPVGLGTTSARSVPSNQIGDTKCENNIDEATE